MLKRALHYLTLSLAALFVLGCSTLDTSDTYPVPSTLPTPFPGYTFPLLDLANSKIPLPNNILLNPTTGKLNFPGTTEPFTAANSLDGFSTSGAILIPFRGTVVADSVTNETLPVYNVTTGQPALMKYTVSENETGSVVTAVPVLALDHSTRYVVVVTSGVMSALSNTPVLADNAINILKGTQPLIDSNGKTTNSAITDEQAASLEPIRQLSQQTYGDAENLTGVSRRDIPLAFEFTTQTLFATLPIVRDQVVTANEGLKNANPAFLADPVGNAGAEFAPVGMGHETNPGGFSTTAPFNNEAPGNGSNLDFAPINIPTVERFMAQNVSPNIPTAGIGRIHLGSFKAPTFRADPVEGFWATPPVQVGTRDVSFVMYLPNDAQYPDALQGVGGLPAPGPNAPVPVVIFQHGITGNKFQSAALANAVCSPPPNGLGAALIAIDLELHGDLTQPAPSNDSSLSGAGFVNIPNLRNSRDNILSSVVNLYALNQAITSGQSNIDHPAPTNAPELGAPNVNAAFPNPSFIGMSLGSIVGDVFHATEPNLTASALNVGGARITNLLLSSETFRPRVVDGLAAAGVAEGTSAFAQFFIIAQAVVDDADPVNYADQAISGTLRGGTGAKILQQVNVTDAVVPPVAQYDMAIQHANGSSSPAFSQVDAIAVQALIAQVSSPFTGSGMYEIPNAGHGALLDPSAGPTAAIVGQALRFLGTAMATGTGTIVDTNIRARQVPTELLEDTTNYDHVVKF